MNVQENWIAVIYMFTMRRNTLRYCALLAGTQMNVPNRTVVGESLMTISIFINFLVTAIPTPQRYVSKIWPSIY
jgi:hypothetical protein